MSSQPARPWVRRRTRSSIVGHPGAFLKSGGGRFSSSPRSPLLQTARGGGGLLTLSLRGKVMDGLEEQQGRTRPQLFHRALKTGGTDAGFQHRQQTAALRRVASVVSSLPTNGMNN